MKDDNDARMRDHVQRMLATTRGWRPTGETADGDRTMIDGDGGARVVVTRVWTGARGQDGLARNAAAYACRASAGTAGGVLAIMSSVDRAQRMVIADALGDVELLDERELFDMAMATDARAVEDYGTIVRHAGFGRARLAA